VPFVGEGLASFVTIDDLVAPEVDVGADVKADAVDAVAEDVEVMEVITAEVEMVCSDFVADRVVVEDLVEEYTSSSSLGKSFKSLHARYSTVEK
jgi:hypothetical protein